MAGLVDANCLDCPQLSFNDVVQVGSGSAPCALPLQWVDNRDSVVCLQILVAMALYSNPNPLVPEEERLIGFIKGAVLAQPPS